MQEGGNGMKPIIVLSVLTLAAGLWAADVELQTSDGQTVRGSLVKAGEEEVELKTDFGIVKIPRKQIKNPEAIDAAQAEAKRPPAKAVLAGGRLNEEGILTGRARAADAGKLTGKENAEAARLVGRFGDALGLEQDQIVQRLRELVPRVNELVNLAYKRPVEIETRARLMAALAVRGNVSAMPILRQTHEDLYKAWERKLDETPDKNSFFDRGARKVNTKEEIRRQAKLMADLLPVLEGNAAEIGGADAMLFLARAFRDRYGNKELKELHNRDRDTLHLLYAAVDEPGVVLAKKQAPLNVHWTPEERALAIEKLIAHLEAPPKDYAKMLFPALGTLLPPGHPDFVAAAADWQDWWGEARAAVLKAPIDRSVPEVAVPRDARKPIETSREEERP